MRKSLITALATAYARGYISREAARFELTDEEIKAFEARVSKLRGERTEELRY